MKWFCLLNGKERRILLYMDTEWENTQFTRCRHDLVNLWVVCLMKRRVDNNVLKSDEKEMIFKDQWPVSWLFLWSSHSIVFKSKAAHYTAGTLSMGTRIAAMETNNGTYCLQKRIEKFPLIGLTSKETKID